MVIMSVVENDVLMDKIFSNKKKKVQIWSCVVFWGFRCSSLISFPRINLFSSLRFSSKMNLRHFLNFKQSLLQHSYKMGSRSTPDIARMSDDCLRKVFIQGPFSEFDKLFPPFYACTQSWSAASSLIYIYNNCVVVLYTRNCTLAFVFRWFCLLEIPQARVGKFPGQVASYC